MKKTIFFALSFSALILLAAFKKNAEGDKLVSKTGQVTFFSHTSAEDISAVNYKVTATLDPTTGDVVFVFPMQSFEFEKALMQKHFNGKDFLDTKQYPKSKFKGTITNLGDIDFKKDGTYSAKVKGELTIKGVTKSVNETGTIKVLGDKITIEAKSKVVLADYNISFSKGKPSTNVAKEVEVTLTTEF